MCCWLSTDMLRAYLFIAMMPRAEARRRAPFMEWANWTLAIPATMATMMTTTKLTTKTRKTRRKSPRSRPKPSPKPMAVNRPLVVAAKVAHRVVAAPKR